METRKPGQIIVHPNLEIASKRRQQQLFEECLAISREDAKRVGALGYMARAMVQASLPYKEPPKTLQAWGRTNGRISLLIQPGYTLAKAPGGGQPVPVNMGYPFGTIPRLLLAWISTEAVRTQQRDLHLGGSLARFMENLGMDNATGGEKGSITRLREQMKRLFSATIAVVQEGDDSGSESWRRQGFQITDDAQIWWDPASPDQVGLFRSSITLSDRFFSELIANPVPIDLRALRALKQSPLALDIYCWLTWRYFALSRPHLVPWDSLKMQFGSQVASDSKFRQVFRRALAQTLAVYPQAKLEDGPTGLRLIPSSTSIPKSA